MELTPIYGLKKPTAFDNADLRIFVGDNMELIETAIGTKISQTDADGRYSAIGHTHGWTEITGKPTEIVTGLASALRVGGIRVGNGLGMSGEYLYAKTGAGLLIDANYALGIDATYFDTRYAPIAHTHAIADVTDLQTALDSKIGAGTTLTTGLDFSLSNGATALTIEGANNDINVFDVGMGDHWGFRLSYIGSGSGNDNLLILRTDNQNIATPDFLDVFTVYQDGTFKFHNQVIIENTGSVSLELRADTDNATETDIPTLSFSSDGNLTRTNMGIDENNITYIQPIHYFGQTNQNNATLAYKGHDGTNFPIHHEGRIEAIKTPVFQNGWGNYGSIYRDACYWKTQDGLVVIEGLIVGGTTSAYCFTLPVGYRPSEYLIFTTFSYLGACRVDVHTNGGVYMNTQTHPSFTSLSGICFKAEA